MPTAGENTGHSVEVSPAAARDLKQLAKQVSPEQLREIDDKIAALEKDPRPPGCKKLSGTKRGSSIYRIRTGNFRIVYEVVDESRRIEIARVRHRKDVYRG